MNAWRLKNRKMRIVSILMALSGISFGTVSSDAANLAITVPSTYSQSQIGAVTGSRVTSKVDSDVKAAVVNSVVGDSAAYTYHANGESKIYLRAYKMGDTELKEDQVLDADSDWNSPDGKGTITALSNAHAATGNDNYVFGTGYDKGKIAVMKVSDGKLVELTGKTVDIKETILNNDLANYEDAVSVHGEGIAVRGNSLFVLANVNMTGSYTDYDKSWLLQYKIADDGSLSYAGYTRVGKNVDQSRLNFYNDRIFISAIGGYQNYGSGNAETTITASKLVDGKLTADGTVSVTAPAAVKNLGYDMRDIKVMPNGTAYILTYNVTSGGTGARFIVYKTTVSNLLSSNPQDWEKIATLDRNGYFGKLNAEYYTKRLWLEAGNNLLVYTDGSTNPNEWAASEFASISDYQLFNSVAMIEPDWVTGALAQLPEGSAVSAVEAPGTYNFRQTITGSEDDSAYSAATTDYSKYSFSEDTTIGRYGSLAKGDLTNNVMAAIFARDGNDIDIDAGTHSLTLYVSDTVATPVGIYAGSGKDVTVTAGTLNIITEGYEGGNSLTNAIWNDPALSEGSRITINAPVNILMTGGYGGNGIAIQKTDRWGEASNESSGTSSVVINGDVSILGKDSSTWGIGLARDNVYSRFNNAGILTSVNNSEVTVNGNVNFTVYGNGITTNAAGSRVSVNGGHIIVPNGMNYGYYTLGAYQGTINVNTGTEGNAPGNNEVKLDGDIFTLNTGTVNVALTTSGSYLKGIVDNGGTANLWLQNGATWTNEAANTRYKEEDEDIGNGEKSHITKLIGGSSKENAGVIYQTAASKDLTIDRYSGYTALLYSHNAEDAGTVLGGSVTIGAADAGSYITIRTDYDASMNTEEAQEKVLNALAAKIIYNGYSSSPDNLSGQVEIAESLTASAAYKYMGKLGFSSNGQGKLDGASEPEKEQTKTEFSTAITGGEDTEYVDDGVLKEGIYTFTKDKSTVTVADGSAVSAEKDVTIAADGKELSLSGKTAGISVGEGKSVSITASKLTANGIDTSGNVTIKGDAEISGSENAIHTTGNGAVILDAAVITGNVNIEGGGLSLNGASSVSGNVTNAGTITADDSLNVQNITNSGTVVLQGATTAKTVSTSGTLAVSQNASLKADAVQVSGGNFNAEGNVESESLSATGEAKAILSGGTYTIDTLDAENGGEISLAGTGVLKVIKAGTDSKVTANLSGDNSGLTGNISGDGVVSLALSDSAVWEGSSANENLALVLNGTEWKNTGASKAASLIGKNGVIDMTGADAGDISIGNYSGNHTILYKHSITDGTPTVSGGTFTISNAAEGSSIILRTDNTGLDTDSTEYDAMNLVSETLNALANKLMYSAYVSGERNLTGTVEIAEGLTSSAASLKTGAITYKEDGQGQYEYTPATPSAQTKAEFTSAITGDESVDTEYVESGVLKDGVYTFTKDKTTINAPKTVVNGGPWVSKGVSAAVSGASADNSVEIELNGKELEINSTSDTNTTGITAIGDGKVEINDAGAISVSVESTGGGQTAALFVNGGGTLAIHNGGDNLDGKILTLRADTTAKANGAVIKSMNGASGKTSSITIDGLVDVLADGDMTDGKGANEAVSAVASNITIGGGTIRAINGASYAIRAYGEYSSTNVGTVNVNVTKDDDGNVTGAGINKTVIEGNFATVGGMGTKGLINIGLGTSDSSWTGNYTTNGGNVNVYMDQGATWTGYNSGKNFMLSLKNNSTWKNTGTSKISTLAATSGIVDMTAEGAGKVTVASYSGSAMVLYNHETGEDGSFSVSGGDFTITSASEGSAITLLTDSVGVKMNDEDSINGLLDALAKKLYYTGYINVTGDDGNVTEGERNLTGIVKIAEGLTASSAAKQTGNVLFSEETGQGSLDKTSVTPGPEYPDSQTTDTFTQAITGDDKADKLYKQSGVLKDGVYTFTKNPTSISVSENNTEINGMDAACAILAADNDVVVNAGGTKLSLEGKASENTQGVGIYAASGHTVTIAADSVEVNQSGEGESTGILAEGTVAITGNAVVSSDIGIHAAENGIVTVSGTAAVSGKTAGILAEKNSAVTLGNTSEIISDGIAIGAAENAKVTVRDGTISGNIETSGGTISINEEAADKAVILQGDVISADGGSINLSLVGEDSAMTGYVDHSTGDVTMRIADGAVWTYIDKDLTKSSFFSNADGNGNFVLRGGDTEEKAGIILHKSTEELRATEYSGHLAVKYAHTGTGSDTEKDYSSGNTVIEKAASGSSITLITDGVGINTEDKTAVEATMNGLAGKLYYEDNINNADNLALKLKIAESLTSSGVLWTGKGAYLSDGQGMYAVGTAEQTKKDPDIIYGPKETAMIRGAKSAMTTSMLSWRSGMTDLNTRMGELHLGAEDGIWARTYGGKAKYDKNNTNSSNSFWGAQVGIDKLNANGWHLGGAFDYNDGDASYEMGGKGDPKLYAFSLYATKLKEDGQYFDIVLKAGRAENDYTVYNDSGYKLDGDYHATGYGLSLEYGKRFGKSENYIQPEIQLAVSRLGSADYDAVSNYAGGKKMHVSQDSLTSVIGRLGIAAGRETAKGEYHIKASVLHEFSGDTKATFAAENEPTKTVDEDFGDTWAELAVGGSWKLGRDKMLYADLVRSFGGDYEMQWKANIGLRFAF